MNSSRIVELKSKFFIYRALTYSSFLLLPVWIGKLLSFNQLFHAMLMILYILFMAGQWFLLGKEIDHRLKIYFKTNSSMDRIIYRLVLGKTTLFLYFGLLSLLPRNLWDDFFWGTWVVLGLFYSWPTRGKIIQETVSSNLGEFKFLDSFEKTLVGLGLFIFLISFPELPNLQTTETLKLFFDPADRFSSQYWNFLTLHYYPFHKYPHLFEIAWCLHFYAVGMGIFLITFYSILRVFLNRRLALLGVFTILSSWSFSKELGSNLGLTISASFSLLWIWSILWGSKSSTYRSGLFIGLLGYWACTLNQLYFLLLPIQIILFYFFFLPGSTNWYKRQLIRYTSFGFLMGFITIVTNMNLAESISPQGWPEISETFLRILNRKAFLFLSIIGLIIFALKFFFPNQKEVKTFRLDIFKLKEFILSLLILLIFSFTLHHSLLGAFTIMSILVFLSLIPLEWLFQSISRLRSRRNMIFMVYIVICLLDSHLEGRLKILAKLLN